MVDSNLSTFILAAGQGTRMRSKTPKLCHPLGGRPLIHYVLDLALKLNSCKTTVVVSDAAEAVTKTIEDFCDAGFKVELSIQHEQRGTGHALMAAQDQWKGVKGPLLVLFGDTPLLTLETLETMMRVYQEHKPAVVTLGMHCTSENRYGRIELDDKGEVLAIVEYGDATPQQRQNSLCNSGVILIEGAKLPGLMDQLKPDNKQGEYYLTDIVHIARAQKERVLCVEGAEKELLGVNTRVDLSRAEAILQQRWRKKAMIQGATFIDPQSVFLSFDTAVGQDVTFFPNVTLGPGVHIEDNVTIRPCCHLEHAHVQDGATVGPFAHVRPGSRIGPDSRIGNFVEIKNSEIGKGAKVNHLSYIGDTDLGDGANVGAGTITCNYDGFSKHRTQIGRQAFIGSNSCLVAPVQVGDQAIVGAGSVITREISKDDLAYSRAPQQNIKSGAASYRRKKSLK